MKPESYQNIQQAAERLMQFVNQHSYCSGAHTISKYVAGLYTIKQQKWDINPHELMALDPNNFDDLCTVMSYMHNSNCGVNALFEDEFIASTLSR